MCIRDSSKSDVFIRFNSQYNNLSAEHKSRINEIAVYKNNVFQFVISNPNAELFIDHDEVKGANHCYRFAFVSNLKSLLEREESRLSDKECFIVE